ncbi:MAG: hypothetical protein LBG65_01175 [Puniceicoccales bacterium]|jgi:hypothetical protein|nr:hypothetical protein [Puniceicoccales bacterium]
MNVLRILPLPVFVLAAAALSGCTDTYDTDKVGHGVQIEPAHNFLGIVKYSPGAFTPIGTTTADVHTDELCARRDFSGGRVSLLGGLITIADY